MSNAARVHPLPEASRTLEEAIRRYEHEHDKWVRLWREHAILERQCRRLARDNEQLHQLLRERTTALKSATQQRDHYRNLYDKTMALLHALQTQPKC